MPRYLTRWWEEKAALPDPVPPPGKEFDRYFRKISRRLDATFGRFSAAFSFNRELPNLNCRAYAGTQSLNNGLDILTLAAAHSAFRRLHLSHHRHFFLKHSAIDSLRRLGDPLATESVSLVHYRYTLLQPPPVPK